MISAHEVGKRVPASELHQGSPIMVLAPHPDDESLGCGALLAAAWGGPGAHVVCLSDGAGSHPQSKRFPPACLARIRAHELDNAVVALGGAVHDITRLDYADGWVPGEGAKAKHIAERIAAQCETLGCQKLFSTSCLDAHADHKATASIAEQVSLLLPSIVVMQYPIWSRYDTPELLYETILQQRTFVLDTHPWQSVKRQAIQCHRTQLGLVVDDDPTGFVLQTTMIEQFATGPELFVEVDHAPCIT